MKSEKTDAVHSWRPVYKCLACGECFVFTEKREMTEEDAEALVFGLASGSQNYDAERKKYPQTVCHNCLGDGRLVGVALFAGFEKE